MKQSTLAVYLFVCGGDLTVLRDVSVSRSIIFAPLSLSLLSFFFLHLFPMFPSFSSSSPCLFFFCVCLPIRVCDRCSLLSTFTRLRDLHWPSPQMPSPTSLPFLSSFLLCYVLHTHFTYRKSRWKALFRWQMLNFKKEQKRLAGKESPEIFVATEWGEGMYEGGKSRIR